MVGLQPIQISNYRDTIHSLDPCGTRTRSHEAGGQVLHGCAQGDGDRCRLDARQLIVLYVRRQHDSSLGCGRQCLGKGDV